MSRFLSAPNFQPGLFITVFTDASYCPNTGAWGYGFWMKYGQPAKTVTGGGGGMTTKSSFEAELAALRHALTHLGENLEADDLKGKRLVLQSDCTGALAAIQIDLIHFRRNHQLAMAYTKHVKGHQGHATPRNSVNTTCDSIARRHMKHHRHLHNSKPKES